MTIKTYALVRKTFPPRRTTRRPYLFVVLEQTYRERAARVVNGGPTYELVETVTAVNATMAVEDLQPRHTEQIWQGEVL